MSLMDREETLEQQLVDDDGEFDDAAGNKNLLGFMFGNIDDSGDLDIDYLDEDAKDHLSALAGELGSSLNELHLSASVRHAQEASTDQEYGKAEDAVDYEDIEEQYVGPETEEDFFLSKNGVFPADMSAGTFQPSTSIFDDENYDEEDENGALIGDKSEAEQVGMSGAQNNPFIAGIQGNELTLDHPDVVKTGNLPDEMLPDEAMDGSMKHQPAPLPILCVDNGITILKFSEIFGISEPIKKRENMNRTRACRPKSSDLSVVEDDEEDYLRGNRRVSVMKQWKPKRIHYSLVGEGFEHDKFDADDQRSMYGGRFDRCLSSQPMKEDMEQDLSIAPQLNSSEFYPLDHDDWEDWIIWGDCPTHDNYADTSMVMRSQNATSNFGEESLDRNDGLYPVSESSACWNRKRTNSLPERMSHPQLMRLESMLLCNASAKNFSASANYQGSDMIKKIGKFILQNKEIMEGTWLERVIWDIQQPVSKPKLIFDLEDEHMVFECRDDDHVKYNIHAGAMMITHSLKSLGAKPSNFQVVPSSGGRFNISNDKFYSNRKSSLQLRSYSKKRTSHGIKVLHSIPALRLQTMKQKLSNKDLANFHRPRALWYPYDNGLVLKEEGILSSHGHVKILLRNLGGKGNKFLVNTEETVSSLKTRASRKLDFKPSEPVKIFYSGKELEDDKTLVFQDVRPNSLLHLVRTKVHLLPRAQRLPGENKSLRPPGAFKKKSDLSARDGHVFLMEYCEERPLLLGNAGMGARLCTYYQKSAPGDQTASQLRSGESCLGTISPLDPTDKSPFLGEIKPGSYQTCIETNMYRAPIFSHRVSSTDYLLLRSPKGKLSIRRIDKIHVVGQQEPHVEVMSPGTKCLQSYNLNRLLVYVFREFRAMEKHGLVPCIRADEIYALFASISEPFVKKRLKHCADLQRRPTGEFYWVMRPDFRIPLEEELRRMVTPEDVCAFESMQAGLFRLKRMGITKLTHPTGISTAMGHLPDEAITLAAASHIERELHITPWNLSSNFVACTRQDRESIERLEITGVGDPTGRGIGFSYVRVAPKPPVSSAMLKKKSVVPRGGATVTGTDADLRRLSMDAAREVLLKFNVPDEQIAKQTRWHRIAMIRKLSSEKATAGVKVDPTAITKFARGQRMSFLQLQQQTREKCQEIWDRQVQSLSGVEDDECGSDSEANSDLDSFADDLENLLEAEEEGDVVEVLYDAKHDKTDGVKGLKMRKHKSDVRAEEELEDEAAEVAELRRMLLDDDEIDHENRKSSVWEDSVLANGPQSSFAFTNADKLKRTAGGKKQLERSYVAKNIGDVPKDAEGLKPMKKIEFDSKSLGSKRVKVMGNGVRVMKEKKSTRESFVCGACGQLGHMRTNKHCPRYGEDLESQTEGKEPEKVVLKPSIAIDAVSTQVTPKPTAKKLVAKTATKIAITEASEGEMSRTKILPVKFKCASVGKVPEKVSLPHWQVKEPPSSEPETAAKVNKLVIYNKPSKVESHKMPSVVIHPPAEVDREQLHKKIVIKRSKEPEDLVRETSRRMEKHHPYKSSRDVRERDVEDNRGNMERRRAESGRWRQDGMEEQERLAELRRYENIIRREREEEERQKATRKMKQRPGLWDDYVEDYGVGRGSSRRPGPAFRASKRRSLQFSKYSSDYAPASKRRRRGEVGLANILERIVDTLKDRHEISYLFLRPVTKKEAPDYLHFIERPMDLSMIRDKVRKMEYRSREEFRHDIWQITYNAHQYNDGRNPGIPPLADQLLELCDYLLVEYDDDLTETEQGIDFNDT